VAQSFNDQTGQAQASQYASTRSGFEQILTEQQAAVTDLLTRLDALKAQPPSPATDIESARLQGELTEAQSGYSATLRSLRDLEMAQVRTGSALTVVEPAAIPDRPGGPSRALMLGLAALAGLAVAIAVAVLAEFSDNRIGGSMQVARTTGLPTWGTVPTATTGSEQRMAERYRLVLAGLPVAGPNPAARTLVVTGALPGDGASVTAASLAIALAETGRRVALVDANLRSPSQMRLFDLPDRDGLATVLAENGQPIAAVLQPVSVPGLHVVAAGPATINPSGLLSSRRFQQALEDLLAAVDVVVLDSPPILAHADAVILGQQSDAALLVVDAQRSRVPDVVQAAEALKRTGLDRIGTVLNRVAEKPARHPAHGKRGSGADSVASDGSVASRQIAAVLGERSVAP
jgi:non-specific protein-tyrosine kinase